MSTFPVLLLFKPFGQQDIFFFTLKCVVVEEEGILIFYSN